MIARAPAVLSGVAAGLLIAACGETPAAPDPGPASWSVNRTSVDLAIGAEDTLLLTFRNAAGELVGTSDINWQWLDVETYCDTHVIFPCPLVFQGTGPRANPLPFIVRADRAMTTSATVLYGEWRGCVDPPECLIKNWEDHLPQLHVQVTIH